MLHQGLALLPRVHLVFLSSSLSKTVCLPLIKCSGNLSFYWTSIFLLIFTFFYPLVLLPPLKSAFLIFSHILGVFSFSHIYTGTALFHAVVKTSVRLIAFSRVSFRNGTIFSIRIKLTSRDCISLLTSTVTYIWKIK